MMKPEAITVHLDADQISSLKEVHNDSPVAVSTTYSNRHFLLSPYLQNRPEAKFKIVHSENCSHVFNGCKEDKDILDKAREYYATGCTWLKYPLLLEDNREPFDKALELIPDHIWSRIRLAQITYLEGNARLACEMLAGLNPEEQHGTEGMDEYCFFHGNALFESGHVKEGLKAWSKTLEYNPHFLEAMNNRGVAFAITDNKTKAIKEFEKAIDIYPTYNDATLNLIRLARLNIPNIKLKLTRCLITFC